jgi:hypothetical protein
MKLIKFVQYEICTPLAHIFTFFNILITLTLPSTYIYINMAFKKENLQNTIWSTGH